MITFDNPRTVPAPGGPYSHVATIPAGDSTLLFVAGQVAVDDTGALVGEGDMGEQTRVVMEILGGILAAHGASFDDVVNIRSFVTDMDRLAEVAEVRRRYLSEPWPTSTSVEVSRLFLPGALIEVEVVAAISRRV